MEKTAQIKNKHLKDMPKRVTALWLCVVMLFSLVVSALLTASASPVAGFSSGGSGGIAYTRTADPGTMDKYIDAVLGGWNSTEKEIQRNDGSRYAGQVWVDKSVFAYNVSDDKATWDGSELTLHEKTDGLGDTITLPGGSDFLHVFSALGSTEQITGQTPVDLVMVLDMSPSMGDAADAKSKLRQSLKAINQAIQTVMESNDQNRVGLLVFSTQVAVMLPLGRYETQWCYGADNLPVKKPVKEEGGGDEPVGAADGEEDKGETGVYIWCAQNGADYTSYPLSVVFPICTNTKIKTGVKEPNDVITDETMIKSVLGIGQQDRVKSAISGKGYLFCWRQRRRPCVQCKFCLSGLDKVVDGADVGCKF